MIQINVQKNFKFLKDNHETTRGILLEGGSRSGKTTDTCQFLVWYCLHNTGKVITIGRDKLTTLRTTLLLDFKQVLRWWGREEKTTGVNPQIEINGNLIRFIGTNDDLMKTHGLTQDVFWLNEAMNISKDTIDQLEQRTSDFFILDYNPSAKQHHIYDMDKREDVKLLKTTVLDNAFVPIQARNKILSYEPTPKNITLGTADEYKWEVYGLGKRTSLEGLIFQHYEICDIMPSEYDYKFYGLDFGYSNDQTACVDVRINGKNLYVKELIYETGLLNRDIADRLSDADEDCYIIADNSRGDIIDDLRLNYDVNVVRCSKKKGINYGINQIKSYKVHLHQDSENLINEFNTYKWAMDRQQNLKDLPEDKNNHLIDATRYALSLFNI